MYDLVSVSYGWTDEQIGDLPFGRFRQVVAAIQLRRMSDQRELRSLFSWHARTNATFIAGGYMVDKGKENAGMKAAQNIAYDDVERAAMGIEVRGPKENAKGSYEALSSWASSGMTKR